MKLLLILLFAFFSCNEGNWHLSKKYQCEAVISNSYGQRVYLAEIRVYTNASNNKRYESWVFMDNKWIKWRKINEKKALTIIKLLKHFETPDPTP